MLEAFGIGPGRAEQDFFERCTNIRGSTRVCSKCRLRVHECSSRQVVDLEIAASELTALAREVGQQTRSAAARQSEASMRHSSHCLITLCSETIYKLKSE